MQNGPLAVQTLPLYLKRKPQMRHDKSLTSNKKTKTSVSAISAVAAAVALMGDQAQAQGATDGFKKVAADKYVVTYNDDGSATLTSDGRAIQLAAGEFKVVDGVLYVQDQIAAVSAQAAAGAAGAAAPAAGTMALGALAVVGAAAAVGAAGSGGGSDTPANVAPTVAHAIADQAVVAGAEVHITVPANTFADANHDTLTYSATFADGSALSTRGLSFDATTHIVSGILTGTGPATIRVTANDGNGGTVSDAFVLNQATGPVVTATGALALAENAGAGAAIVTATASEAITHWSLSGADAGLFSISSSGVVTAVGSFDHEAATDANHDGVYSFTINATGASGTGSQVVTVAVTDVTELPGWLANATQYGVGYTAPGSITDANEVTSNGVYSLLSGDHDAGTGSQSHWDGDGTYNTPTALTFGFIDAGGVLQPSSGTSVTMTESYNNVERAFIRGVFEHFSNVSGLTFTEQSGAAATNADLRMGVGTYSELGVTADVLGFAFQPSGADPRADSIFGDFFLVSDANGLVNTANPFSSAYGDERNTISHELGHALGLDHPFSDSTANSGFAPITSTADLHPDYTGEQTGGGYQTQYTDNVMESIMAYYNPYSQTPDMGSNSLTNTPWQLSINDIAALQHLYGANMTFEAGDNTYTFSSDTQVFTTIWDAGGTDSIVQTGSRSALIDLNEGAYSRVGFLGGRSYTFTASDLGLSGSSIDAATLVESTDGIVTVAADHQSFTFTTDLTVGGLDDDLSFNVTVDGVAHNGVGGINGLSVDHSNNGFNLGIAYGVTIENATGGSGADTITGNSAANTIIGGAGNDVLTGGAGGDTFGFSAGFGADRITDFTTGQDVIHFDGFSALTGTSVVGGDTVIDMGAGNSITLVGFTHGLTAGTDYVFA